ncbi:hypothetical protein AURANDRAFT_68435, partial [Aureococcus anophagefferens]
MASLEERVVAWLREEKVKLWLAPYDDDGALTATASTYAAALDEADVAAVAATLRDLRRRAVEKLAAKRRRTVRGAGAAGEPFEVALDGGTAGADARAVLAAAGGYDGRVRVIAGGRALVDGATLAAQGWPSDAERAGRPLRAILIAEPAAPAVDEPSEVDRLLDACDRLARDRAFDISDGRSGRRVRVPPAARPALVQAVALHARGKRCGDAAAAIDFFLAADEAFDRVRAAAPALVDEVDNFGFLQLDLCRAYALLGDGALLLPLCLSRAASFLRARCDVTNVTDARFKRVAPQPLQGWAVPDSDVVVGPLPCKTGSTTLRDFVIDRRGGVEIKGLDAFRAAAARGAALYSSARHPVERFVSGYRQLDVFYKMGWIQKSWFTGACRLTWPEDWCEPSYALRAGAERPGLASDVATQYRRLERFVADVERCGFFNKHIMPMALSFNQGLDMRDYDFLRTDDLAADLAAALPGAGAAGVAMRTGGSRWAKRMAADAADARSPHRALARSLLARICDLVRVDLDCFPAFGGGGDDVCAAAAGTAAATDE